MILNCPLCSDEYDAARYEGRRVEVWIVCRAGHFYGVQLAAPGEARVVRVQDLTVKEAPNAAD